MTIPMTDTRRLDAIIDAMQFEHPEEKEILFGVELGYYTDQPSIETALGIYERNLLWDRAVRLAIRYDLPERGIQVFEDKGDFCVAGRLWAELGNQEKAAENFERAGRYGIAAIFWSAYGDHDHALRNAEQSGDDFLVKALKDKYSISAVSERPEQRYSDVVPKEGAAIIPFPGAKSSQ